MPSKLYYTIPAEHYQLSSEWKDEEVCYNLVIQNWGQLTTAFLKKLCQRQVAFLLTFEVHLFEYWNPEKQNALLYALLSLNAYDQVSGVKVIFVKGEISNEAVAGIERIKAFFSEQAEVIQVVNMPLQVNADSNIPEAGTILILNNEHLKQFFSATAFLKNVRAIQQASIILMEAVWQSTASLYEADVTFPALEILIHQTIVSKELQHENQLLEQRAKLYLDFIAIGKDVQQKEYYELLNWYKNEYEVLPLWYKRVGHLIKAAMGKRTFKSLFNR